MSISNVIPNLFPLQTTPFSFLPLGTVKPLGWLQRQLHIQANGQSTALMSNWTDLMSSSSGWCGGTGESWERGAYYLDGMIPTAYLLDNKDLINRLQQWIEWILQSQRSNGWFGPARNEDWWPLMVALKSLAQYQEATGDTRVIPFMERYFAYQLSELPNRPLREWGQARGTENALSVLWLYNRTQDQNLLHLFDLINTQTLNWSEYFHTYDWANIPQPFQFRHERHIVNIAMGLKNPSIRWLYSCGERDRIAVYKGLSEITKYHGQVTGMFGGDEHLSGNTPTRGTQLCAVVETIFSLIHLAQIHGDLMFGDYLERVVYNALPAMFDHEMWTHQFNQQVNQIFCSDAPRDWVNNGNTSNLFGLEPNFGCCTSNYHQGWPKFIAHMWMATTGNGLAAIAYGPCQVQVRINDQQVTIVEQTEYPFDDTIVFTIKTTQPIEFPLLLRVPVWASSAVLITKGETQNLVAGQYHQINHLWCDGDIITLHLPMDLVSQKRPQNAIALERGPLIFALKIDEDWVPYSGQPPLVTYEVHPISDWNYALALPSDDTHPLQDAIRVHRSSISQYPFDPDSPPVSLHMRAYRVPSWNVVHNSAGPTPPSPVPNDQLGTATEITLIPYGSSNLRITEFPVAQIAK